MKSAIVATSPLRSGQVINKIAEFFMTIGSPCKQALQTWLFLEAFQNLARGVGSRSPGQSCSRMGSATAKIEIFNRRFVTSPIQQRTHGEELVQREIAVKDLPTRKPVLLFQVEGRDDLVREDQLRQIRRILRQRLHHRLPQGFSLLLPVTLELVGSVLHVYGHHVLAFGRQGGVGQRWNGDFKVGLFRELAVL